MNASKTTNFLLLLCFCLGTSKQIHAQSNPDFLREMQFLAVETGKSDWIHWGDKPKVFSNWTSHSNRLIPVYTFGISLESVKGANSVYRSEDGLKKLYGKLPTFSLNPNANYFDQTDVYRLQQEAFAAGKKNVILMVFDGMDWQTTQAASIYKNQEVLYRKYRGKGLSFLDYRGGPTDYGFCVTAPHNNDTKKNVDAQLLTAFGGEEKVGGYCPECGGRTPWEIPGAPAYLMGRRKSVPHMYADSAATATSMNTGIKTYNSSINIAPDGSQVETIAHQKQREGYSIGVVTSVPISHATPACTYSHNVSRNDYQDLTRDLLGMKSIAHFETPLSGVDVLIGCGWGEVKEDNVADQGVNFVPGNKYLSSADLDRIDVENGGRYVVAQRTAGVAGREALNSGAQLAAKNKQRLFGYFGAMGGHLPYRTADGKFDPTRGKKNVDVYSQADVLENPTLADMAEAALSVLETNDKGFWLMIEAGDVDWANHNNNIDDSIGAVLSGEAAFDVVTNWVESNSSWDETAVILTADHGHMLVLEDLEALAGARVAPPTTTIGEFESGGLSESKLDKPK